MRFYEVSAKQGTQFYDGEWEPFPASLSGLHSDHPVPSDLRVRVRTGAKPGDLIFATDNVVSPRFLDLLMTTQATGYSTFPVPLVRGDEVLATFHCLRVTGRGGAFDVARSNARIVNGSVFSHSAVYMDESGWDGSDVFFVPGLGIALFVTERIATAMKKAHLLNVRLTPNNECRMI